MRKKIEKKIFNRFNALLLIMVLVAGLIGNRLFQMQIVNGEEAKIKADSGSVKDITEPAPRGQILDNDGEVLATSLPAYDLIYNETKESSENFYDAMGELFKLLDVTGEKLNDEFALKFKDGKFYFDFRVTNPESVKIRELRWKKDRGINDYILKSGYGKLIGKSNLNDLSDEESQELDKMILALSPEETFNYLVKYHDLYKILKLDSAGNKELSKKTGDEIAKEILKKYDAETARKYLLINDAVYMKIYASDKSVVLAKNIKKESAFVFMQKSNMLSGVNVQLNPIRVYPYGSLASHILGYISTISESNKDTYEAMGYDVNKDKIGVYGIEEAFERELRGSKTVSTVKVDGQGRTISELFKLEGYPGLNLELSIDKDLQYTAEKALEKNMNDLRTVNVHHFQGDSNNATRGAVVVINVKTGKILAMASNPDFDPNVFVSGTLTDQLYEKYFYPDFDKFYTKIVTDLNIQNKTIDDLFPKDKEGNRYDYYDLYPKPFFNYATQGLSPVGSIFKPFTALAGLEEGVIDRNTTVFDVGKYEREELKGYVGRNNDDVAHGTLNVLDALKVSSNYFFLETGWRLYQKAGPDSLAHWVWKMGLGHDPLEGVHSTTGIEINENIYGNVFNFESRKNLLANYAYTDMMRRLNSGVSRFGKDFKPLDVTFKTTDSEKVRNLKNQMDEGLQKYWKSIKIDDTRSQADLINEVVNILDYNLHALIMELPEAERKGMADSEYYATEVAYDLVYDRGAELNTPVNVMNASIGQGDAELTILQIANAIATIANGGTRYRTSLVDKIVDADGTVVKEIEPEVLEKLNVSQENIDIVKSGMYLVNNNPSGSGYVYFNDFPIKTAGKTGTAEFRDNNDFVGRHQYGTYITFAPYDDPEIAIASIVYDSVHGSYTAPIAKAIYEQYFSDVLKNNYPNYKKSVEYQLRPVMTVEPSLLQLKKPNLINTTPVKQTYTPGEDLPANTVPGN
ncbi:MAG: penicillin-binding transpeptidase domain-containing protein [Clostridiaceae bacterium]